MCYVVLRARNYLRFPPLAGTEDAPICRTPCRCDRRAAGTDASRYTVELRASAAGDRAALDCPISAVSDGVALSDSAAGEFRDVPGAWTLPWADGKTLVLAIEGDDVPARESTIPSGAEAAMLVSADVPKLPIVGGVILLDVEDATTPGVDTATPLDSGDRGTVPRSFGPGYTV